MLGLKNQIVSIIKTEDFVILPKLGGFQANYEKPYLDFEGNLVGAQKALSFNYLYKTDSENKLFNILIEKYGWEAGELERKYKELLKHIESEIETRGEFDWPGLGRISKGEGLSLVFSPEIQNFTQIEIEGLEEKDEDLQGIEKLNFTKSKPQKATLLYFFIAGLVLLLVAAYFIFIDREPSATLKESLESKAKNNSIQVSGDSLPSLVSDSGKVNVLIKSEKTNVEISIGVYKKNKNAENILSILKKKGIKASSRKEGGNIRVFHVVSSLEEANEKINTIEKITKDKPIILWNR
jgi:CCDC81-like prokaryotic HU domain 1